MEYKDYGLDDGLQIIGAEVNRHQTVEGWTPEHDDTHEAGQLADAACCYALHARQRDRLMFAIASLWPWDMKWWKPTPHDRVRELAKAGSLIVQEINRLRRRDRRVNGITEPPAGFGIMFRKAALKAGSDCARIMLGDKADALMLEHPENVALKISRMADTIEGEMAAEITIREGVINRQRSALSYLVDEVERVILARADQMPGHAGGPGAGNARMPLLEDLVKRCKEENLPHIKREEGETLGRALAGRLLMGLFDEFDLELGTPFVESAGALIDDEIDAELSRRYAREEDEWIQAREDYLTATQEARRIMESIKGECDFTLVDMAKIRGNCDTAIKALTEAAQAHDAIPKSRRRKTQKEATELCIEGMREVSKKVGDIQRLANPEGDEVDTRSIDQKCTAILIMLSGTANRAQDKLAYDAGK